MKLWSTRTPDSSTKPELKYLVKYCVFNVCKILCSWKMFIQTTSQHPFDSTLDTWAATKRVKVVQHGGRSHPISWKTPLNQASTRPKTTESLNRDSLTSAHKPLSSAGSSHSNGRMCSLNSWTSYPHLKRDSQFFQWSSWVVNWRGINNILLLPMVCTSKLCFW